MNHAAFLRGVKKYKNDEKKLSDFISAYRRAAIALYERQQRAHEELPGWLPALYLAERHHP